VIRRFGWAAGLLAMAAGPVSARPQVAEAPYGVTSTGAAVRQFTLKNDRGMVARVLDYGGVITEISAPDRRGRMANVVLSLRDLATYETGGNINNLIGRYANRIRGGFTLDGRHYDLQPDARGITSHGGPNSWRTRIWSAAPFANRDAAGVRLSLVSPDGDQGFPGTLRVSVTYALTNAGEFRIGYEASTDQPTVAAFTSHLYLNLAGNGSGPVYGQQLQIIADRYTPTDAAQVPTGELAEVTGTPFDFRRLKPIGQDVASDHPQMRIGKGYDHNFVLRKPAGDPLPLAARLYDPASGRVMELRTTEPGLQVYSGNRFDGTTPGADGMVRQSWGVALETQHFPNSPNTPAFPSTVLRPGEVLRSITVLRFTTDREERASLFSSPAKRGRGTAKGSGGGDRRTAD
jgi:aldose 1-epimerase